MFYIKNQLIIFGLIFLFSLTAHAQWVKEKGKGYYKLSAWYLETDQHYTDTGEKDPNVTRGNFNLNFYGDYGLTDKWDIIAYVPFFARTFQNDVVSGTTGEIIEEGESVNSIGDIDIGLEYGLFNKGNFSASSSIIFGLPTGKNDSGSDGSYQTGDGEFNQFLKLGAGVSFKIKSVPLYSKAYLGFNNRTKDFSDEFRTGFELGANLFNDKVRIIGRSDVVRSLKNGSRDAQTSQGNIFANNIEYVSLGGEANYYFTKTLGVSVAVTGAISGRIIAANPTYLAGVFLDVK